MMIPAAMTAPIIAIVLSPMLVSFTGVGGVGAGGGVGVGSKEAEGGGISLS